ncbi:MAG: glycoside hydrolase family 3 protein [Elusimicrobiaceae bacterium]|nr:glycoside hydrolase family 3 protein [Elusimicrobiaceae bacterium]
MKKSLAIIGSLLLGGILNASAYSQMQELTLREQVGQTIMPRILIGQQKAFKKAVLNGEVTGFFIKAKEGLLVHPDITSKNQAKFLKKQRKKFLKTISDLNKWASKSRHKIPLLLALDYEGGTVTSPMYMGLKQMPSNMLLAASGKEAVVAQMYAAQAREIKAVGANVALGPVTDVNSNPLNPIIQTRSFGDNATQVGQFALAAVRALQAEGVPAFNKHFPGHGDTSSDSHYAQPITDMPVEQLWQNHFSAFQPSVLEAQGVLSAHVVYPSIDAENPASFSSKILKDLLRKKMNFKGVVATDGLDMGAVNGASVENLVLRSYKAGNNILLLSGDASNVKEARTYPRRAADYVEKSVATVQNGGKEEDNVTIEEILSSAQKVLDLKKKMGLFDLPSVANEDTGFEEAALLAAQEGVTLVRDEQYLVPLKDDIKEICTVFFADGIFSLQLKSFNDYLMMNGKNVSSVFAARTPTQKNKQAIGACVDKAQMVVVGTSRTGAMDKKQYETVLSLLEITQQKAQPVVLISLLNPYEIPLYPTAQTVFALYGATQPAMQTAAQILLGHAKANGKLPVQLTSKEAIFTDKKQIGELRQP